MKNLLLPVVYFFCILIPVFSAASTNLNKEVTKIKPDTAQPGLIITRPVSRDAFSMLELVSAQSVSEEAPTEELLAYDDSALNNNMICVDGGMFAMGCIDENSDCWENEKPVHVMAVKSFYISKYEVTQKQWRQIMGSSPSYFKNCDDCPVEQVSWNEVQDFIKRLNAKTGKNYRLPTEAEWEFAARAGGQKISYSNAKNTADLSEMNFNVMSSGSTTPTDNKPRQRTAPVGSFTANNLGLFDMSGNVWEWCSDTYNGYSEATSSTSQTTNNTRVMRGGSWKNVAQFCRTTSRGKEVSSTGNKFIGFRLAMSK